MKVDHCSEKTNKGKKKKVMRGGKGLVNNMLKKLPLELHIPGVRNHSFESNNNNDV